MYALAGARASSHTACGAQQARALSFSADAEVVAAVVQFSGSDVMNAVSMSAFDALWPVRRHDRAVACAFRLSPPTRPQLPSRHISFSLAFSPLSLSCILIAPALCFAPSAMALMQPDACFCCGQVRESRRGGGVRVRPRRQGRAVCAASQCPGVRSSRHGVRDVGTPVQW
jgi:hypothetical protein